jgi:hypothetical protein
MKEYAECTGYLKGSKIGENDAKFNREEEHSFDRMINEQVKFGAIPRWETFRVFSINGMVFGTIIIDISDTSDDWHLNIVNLGD